MRLEAAYASLSGASLVETLARLFGGIGGGMAPVAAKVAVVSVGAAVATGGYVAAPHVLRTPASKPARPVPTHVSVPPPAAVLVAETHSASTSAAAAPAAPVSVSRHVSGDSGEHRTSGGHGSDDGEAAATAGGSERPDTRETDHSGKRASTLERSHGDDGKSSSGKDDSSDGGGSSSSDGSDDGESHGGVTTTAPNPAVTVTVPVADPAPPVGEPVPTTGG
jgi:hypothetical protein